MRGSREGYRGSGPPKNHKSMGFLTNTGPDFLKNQKAIPNTKPSFNNGPSLARKRNAILMAFRWRVDDGLLVGGSMMVCFKWHLDPLFSLHQLTKTVKKVVRVGSLSDKTFWIRACEIARNCAAWLQTILI